MKKSLRSRRPIGGTTLIEVLVATLLLSMSMAALLQLWGVSRRITERSRDLGEAYAVARGEAEWGKAVTFRGLLPLFLTNTIRYSDYGPDGALLTPNVGAGAVVTGTAPNRPLYRAVSTFTLVVTGSESANTQRLGVQRIRVYATKIVGGVETFDLTNTATVPVYETTVFYTAAGV